MPPTLHLWSGNSLEYQAAIARSDARYTKIKQIRAGRKKLLSIANGNSTDVPACLKAIVHATRQVIKAAQRAGILKMQSLIVAEETLQISTSVAYFVQVHGVTETDMLPSLKTKLYRFAGELEEIQKCISGLVLPTELSKIFAFLRHSSLLLNIAKCKEILEHNRKVLSQDYGEYHPMRRQVEGRQMVTVAEPDDTANDSQDAQVQNKINAQPIDLTGDVSKIDDHPVAIGGFADIWKATWNKQSGKRMVAVKVLRYCTNNMEVQNKTTKRLDREIRLWQRLDHVNVLPLHGTTLGFGPNRAMVSSWATNGNLNDYLERDETVLGLSERFNILRDVAAGLSYLHSFSIIHGDLTGSNVLMDGKRRACLSDFGMSTIIADCQGSNSFFSTTIGGAIRWGAVELYRFEQEGYFAALNIDTDIYSFGSVMLQVLTGKVPYYYIPTDFQVIHEKLIRQRHPRRPTESWITDDDWVLIARCWSDHERGHRPSMAEVSKYVGSRPFRPQYTAEYLDQG